ncbi:ribosome maturation factor RimP [Peptoniphilus duerdenii]|uniref:ribosome maturation factor RimP n=1 Tax=Peptoniphilus duerdenii TaxID=507750 RepID=UPI00288AD4B3|nr:ribosome maturation factor RimP [Peptoniphilus duerdenii]
MTSSKGILSKLNEISTKISEERGYEIVEVAYKKATPHSLVSVFIYKEDGISLDDCDTMSRAIEEELDKEDIIEESYYLEVSSPGLDRPIKTQDDLRRNKGKLVEAKLFAPLDGNKLYEGVLASYTKDTVILDNEGKEVELPLKSISKMSQKIVF